jgi:hypothetical protein
MRPSCSQNILREKSGIRPTPDTVIVNFKFLFTGFLYREQWTILGTQKQEKRKKHMHSLLTSYEREQP